MFNVVLFLNVNKFLVCVSLWGNIAQKSRACGQQLFTFYIIILVY